MGRAVLLGMLATACGGPRAPERSLDLQEPPPPREAPSPGIAQTLARVLRGAPPEERLEVQLEARPGETLEGLSDERLLALDARAVTRSRRVMTVTAPVAQVPVLAARDEVGWARLPARPVVDLGPSTTEAVQSTGAARLHCLGVDGTGVEVAIVDHFGDYDRSRLAGELATVVAPPAPSDDPHGTLCAEIVSDMAPGVSLHLVHSDGLADLLAFVESLEDRHVDVMSHSVSYFGYGFGDGQGVLCDAAADAARAGTVWVNSAGNHGSWHVYRSTFTDADGDGWHEFDGAIEVSDVRIVEDRIPGVPMTVRLDWNGYPTTDVDLDLVLRRWDGSGWIVLAESSNVQAGAEPPTEDVTWTTDGGAMAVSIVRRDGGTDPIDLRVFSDEALSHGEPEGSIGDPASCPDVLAVGASRGEDSVEDYSARGPTFDGRTKPELVAPTSVQTSAGSFGGTSAAAPHVTGAIALTMQARGVTAQEAAALLLAEAAEAAHPVPNNRTGWGRLALAAEAAGWQCVPTDEQSCETSCGTTGTQACTATCGWAECVPPVEACNAADDDCDGAADEEFLCVRGAAQACTTTCGTTGTRSCGEGCVYGACLGAEECNGLDDDCDGDVDEEAGCPQRVQYGGCRVAPRGTPASGGTRTTLAALALAIGLAIARRR